MVRLHGSAHCTNLSPKKRSSEFSPAGGRRQGRRLEAQGKFMVPLLNLKMERIMIQGIWQSLEAEYDRRRSPVKRWWNQS